MSNLQKEFDHAKAVQESCHVTRRCPAFVFTVKVILSKDAVEHVKAKVIELNKDLSADKMQIEILGYASEIAENWARSAVRMQYGHQTDKLLFSYPYYTFARVDFYEFAKGNFVFEVLCVYSWG